MKIKRLCSAPAPAWAALLVLSAATVSDARAEERVLAGRLRCAALPALGGAGPLDAPFRLTLDGPRATYSRPLDGASARRSGAAERGEGGAAPGGAVALRGAGAGPDWSFTARYAGSLRPDGSGRLEGEQTWTIGGGRPVARSCEVLFGSEVRTLVR